MLFSSILSCQPDHFPHHLVLSEKRKTPAEPKNSWPITFTLLRYRFLISYIKFDMWNFVTFYSWRARIRKRILAIFLKIFQCSVESSRPRLWDGPHRCLEKQSLLHLLFFYSFFGEFFVFYLFWGRDAPPKGFVLNFVKSPEEREDPFIFSSSIGSWKLGDKT